MSSGALIISPTQHEKLGGNEIRLNPAGRGLACKPSPSNPSRDVRRDIAGAARKQNARFAAGILFITGGAEKFVPLTCSGWRSSNSDETRDSNCGPEPKYRILRRAALQATI